MIVKNVAELASAYSRHFDVAEGKVGLLRAVVTSMANDRSKAVSCFSLRKYKVIYKLLIIDIYRYNSAVSNDLYIIIGICVLYCNTCQNSACSLSRTVYAAVSELINVDISELYELEAAACKQNTVSCQLFNVLRLCLGII